MKTVQKAAVLGILLVTGASAPVQAATNDSRDVLWQGLLGAGTGAIAAEASGGKAGKGALIGAGTNVLGNLVLGLLTGPSSSRPAYAQPVSYSQPASYQPVSQEPSSSYYSTPVTYSQPVYSQPVYASPAPAYYPQPSTQDHSRNVLKQGLLGAGVGAISAEVSGGKAGTGALVGAGTNVIGGALLDTLLAPSTPTASYSYAQPAASYYHAAPAAGVSYGASSSTLKKRIVRKFDANGKLLSEEEFWE